VGSLKVIMQDLHTLWFSWTVLMLENYLHVLNCWHLPGSKLFALS
jgi:hypothetical protein